MFILGQYKHIDEGGMSDYVCIFLDWQSMNHSPLVVSIYIQEPKYYISFSLRNVVICSWTEPLTGTQPIEGEDSAFFYRKKVFIKFG